MGVCMWCVITTVLCGLLQVWNQTETLGNIQKSCLLYWADVADHMIGFFKHICWMAVFCWYCWLWTGKTLQIHLLTDIFLC